MRRHHYKAEPCAECDSKGPHRMACGEGITTYCRGCGALVAIYPWRVRRVVQALRRKSG